MAPIARSESRRVWRHLVAAAHALPTHRGSGRSALLRPRAKSDDSVPAASVDAVSERAGGATHCDGTEPIAIGNVQATARGTAEAMGFFQYCVEHRREVPGRGGDDLP